MTDKRNVLMVVGPCRSRQLFGADNGVAFYQEDAVAAPTTGTGPR